MKYNMGKRDILYRVIYKRTKTDPLAQPAYVGHGVPSMLVPPAHVWPMFKPVAPNFFFPEPLPL